MKPIQSRIFLVSLIRMNEKFSLSKCQYSTKVGHISIEIFMIKKKIYADLHDVENLNLLAFLISKISAIP